MMDQQSLLAYTANVFAEIGVKYCVVGSMASILFGEIRSTQDIDIVVDMKVTHIKPFLAKYPLPEYLVDEAQVREAVLTRFQFNVIHTMTANKLDIIMPGADAWKSGQIQRAKMMYTKASAKSMLLHRKTSSLASCGTTVSGRRTSYS